MIKLVVFDLDGTLLNTIADLANSTNYALKQNGFPTHDVEEYYYFVGNGINKLFERALPEACRTDADVLRIRQSPDKMRQRKVLHQRIQILLVP